MRYSSSITTYHSWNEGKRREAYLISCIGEHLRQLTVIVHGEDGEEDEAKTPPAGPALFSRPKGRAAARAF